MTKIRNSRFAVSMIFAINGALFGTWASRIPAISNIHDLSPASLGLLIFLAGLSAVVAFSIFGRAADYYGAAFVTKLASSIFLPLTLIFIAYANSIWMLIAAIIFFLGVTFRQTGIIGEYIKPAIINFYKIPTNYYKSILTLC